MRVNIFIFIIIFSLSNCQESSNNDDLKQIVDGLNKKCPKMIDSETKFEGIEFIEPNKIIYKFTLINLAVQNVDTTQFKLALWPGILSTVKVSSEMKKLRDNQTNIDYLYLDKYKRQIYTFKIVPENYH